MPKFTKDAKDTIKWNQAKTDVTNNTSLTSANGKVFWDLVLGKYKELGGKFVELKYDDLK